MRARLEQFWDALLSSLWFVPTLVALGAISLALGAVALDQHINNDRLRGMAWIYSGGAEGARAVLSVIAGSVMTVAGVAFSITVAVLSLASGQYGPRLLRNFMRDRGNQVSLGTFIGTFVYCLLVLRTIRSVQEGTVVPPIAVTGGLALGLVSLFQFIYFINHTCVSIQPTSILRGVHQDLNATIDRLFPETIGHEAELPQVAQSAAACLPADFAVTARAIAAQASGYVQAIDAEALMKAASKVNCILSLEGKPGDFLMQGSILALAWPPHCEGTIPADQVRQAFLLSPQRTPTQDLTFAVRQFVEIAVRALSPGINDPFTAVACIDWLSASLCRLAERQQPSPYRYDAAGNLRVIAPVCGFVEAVDTAFHPLREHGQSNPEVILRLLEAILTLSGHVRRLEDREVLLQHTDYLLQTPRQQHTSAVDWNRTEARGREIQRLLRKQEG